MVKGFLESLFYGKHVKTGLYIPKDSPGVRPREPAHGRVVRAPVCHVRYRDHVPENRAGVQSKVMYVPLNCTLYVYTVN